MFLAVLFSLAPPTPPVAQWTFSVGVHDMIVSDVNEYAAGIDAGTSWDVPMRSGAEVLGSLEGLLDQQNDVLDPDHIGLRMMTEHRWIEPFARFGDSTALQGVFDADGKDNTPSSIEWEFRGTYGLAIAYNDGANYASFKTSVGYFAIELDDDVPRTRGYSRDQLRQNQGAYLLALEGGVALAKSFRVMGEARYWGGSDGTLEEQLRLVLTADTERWMARSKIVLRADYTRYDLTRYGGPSSTDPAFEDITTALPWNDDLYLRLSFDLNL